VAVAGAVVIAATVVIAGKHTVRTWMRCALAWVGALQSSSGILGGTSASM